MSDQKLIQRGLQAKAVIENEIYQESWELVRKAIFAKIEAAPLGDKNAIEDLHRCLKLIGSARGNLELFLKLGKDAEARMLVAENPDKVHLFRP